MSMSSLAHNVVARFKAAVYVEAESLLRVLRTRLDQYDKYVEPAKKLQEFYEQYWKAKAQDQNFGGIPEELQSVGRHILYGSLKEYNQDFGLTWPFALAILQQYSLPTNIRKQVEAIAKFWATKQSPRMPNLPHNRNGFERESAAITYYLKYVDTIREHLAILTAAMTKGRPIAKGDAADPMKVKAGSFTLINMGGFSDEVMHQAAETVKKADAQASINGFGAVCYGDVHVADQVGHRNTLAFYLPAQDEIFVQSDISPTAKNIRTLLHELGHRYEQKFLKSHGVLLYLYHAIGNKHRDEIRKLEPAKGEVLVDKGGVPFVVDTVIGENVMMHLQDSVQQKAKIHIEGYYALKGVNPRDTLDFKGYITSYAAKDPSENFAEMFSFYCLNALPPTQKALFEEKVLGITQ